MGDSVNSLNLMLSGDSVPVITPKVNGVPSIENLDLSIPNEDNMLSKELGSGGDPCSNETGALYKVCRAVIPPLNKIKEGIKEKGISLEGDWLKGEGEVSYTHKESGTTWVINPITGKASIQYSTPF